MNDADDIRKAEGKALGYALIIKYLGFVMLVLSLIAIVLASLLRFRLPYMTESIVVAMVLIIIGYVLEILFAQESER